RISRAATLAIHDHCWSSVRRNPSLAGVPEPTSADAFRLWTQNRKRHGSDVAFRDTREGLSRATTIQGAPHRWACESDRWLPNRGQSVKTVRDLVFPESRRHSCHAEDRTGIADGPVLCCD